MKDKNYGDWTIIGKEKVKIDNYIFIKCVCKCGTIRDVRCQNLNSGISKNCGCNRTKKTIARNTKHNKRFSKIWGVWNGMKQRCYNPKNIAYKNYGGRGIIVCDTWKNDFLSFYNAVGDAPDNKSLDRIDNNGNYELLNVKWSTTKEQARNRRTNNNINGICELDISNSLGGKSGLIRKRLKRGWSLERAINKKVHDNS